MSGESDGGCVYRRGLGLFPFVTPVSLGSGSLPTGEGPGEGGTGKQIGPGRPVVPWREGHRGRGEGRGRQLIEEGEGVGEMESGFTEWAPRSGSTGPSLSRRVGGGGPGPVVVRVSSSTFGVGSDRPFRDRVSGVCPGRSSSKPITVPSS